MNTTPDRVKLMRAAAAQARQDLIDRHREEYEALYDQRREEYLTAAGLPLYLPRGRKSILAVQEVSAI